MESKAVFKTYGIDDRGARFQLKEGVHIKFSDGPDKPHMCRICIQNEDGSPNEKGLEKVRMLEASNGYHKGKIYHIPSPEDLRAEQKRKSQEEEAAKYRDFLGKGLFKLDLEQKDIEDLRQLADSIGAKTHDVNGKALARLVQENAIYGVLGVTPPPRGDAAKQRKAKERKLKEE